MINGNELSSLVIRYLHVIDQQSSGEAVILDHQIYIESEVKKTFSEELLLVVSRRKNLKAKAREKIPLESRIPNMLWYVEKDELGVYFFWFIHVSVEERFLFRLMSKTISMVRQEYPKLWDVDGISLSTLRKRVASVISKYNEALCNKGSGRVLLSGSNTRPSILIKSGPDISLETKKMEDDDDDGGEIRVRMQRAKLKLQCIVMTWAITGIVFMIMSFLDIYQRFFQSDNFPSTLDTSSNYYI